MNRNHMDTHNFMLILHGTIDEASSYLLFVAGLDDAASRAKNSFHRPILPIAPAAAAKP